MRSCSIRWHANHVTPSALGVALKTLCRLLVVRPSVGMKRCGSISCDGLRNGYHHAESRTFNKVDA
eukprot:5469602-Pleurochrysis_carterae.AAC.1